MLLPLSRALIGGLDETSPALGKNPGRVISSSNYEPVADGYRRCDGFERFDGQPKPSLASYSYLAFDAGTAAITQGEVVTGLTSGATGKALIAGVLQSGTYGGGDAAGYLILTVVSGTFQDNEALRVGGVTRCIANGVSADRGAPTDDLDATYWQAAQTAARALIAAVPGSGAILGVWAYKGTVYAWRNNAGGTAAVMFKSTAAGWVAVSLGTYLKFNTGGGGAYQPQEGDSVIGASSGATCTIRRIGTTAGAWDGTKVGHFVISGVTGAFTNGENLTINGHAAAAKAVNSQVTITLLPGGRFECANNNFYGRTNLYRMYGCDGVNPAFEFDGTYFCPIFTGMAADTPNHLAIHCKKLFLAFPGGSLQFSSEGEPTQWIVVLGAGEIGIGDDCTGLLAPVNGALVAFAVNRTGYLTGTSALDFNYTELNEEAGAQAWTAQALSTPLYMDNRGIRKLSTTNAYGNWKLGLVSMDCDTTMTRKKKANVYPVASVRCKTKGQYRIFFSDGTGLVFYMGRKNPEVMQFDLGMRVYTASSSEGLDKLEQMYFGDENGFVYQLDSGLNFDGQAVHAYIKFAFDACGTPRFNKRFSHVVFETDAAPSAALKFTTETSYGDAEQPVTPEQDVSVSGGGGFWNEDLWNEFYWSSPKYGLATADLDTSGTNLGVTVMSQATYEKPHTLQAMHIYFSRRGLALT